MPIIPRYQARGGPSVGGLNYAGAYAPPGGEDWRLLAQAARAGGAILDGVQALKGAPDEPVDRSRRETSNPENRSTPLAEVVDGKARDVAWRRRQLERPEADLQAVARSRDAAGQGLEPAARAVFDRLSGPREAGYAAAGAGRAEAELRAMAHQLSEDRQALGVDEYVQLADSAPDQARAALGSAIGELTERLAAMGAGGETIDAGRRELLGEAVGRRIRQTLADDPGRAARLLETEGGVLEERAQGRLRTEIEAEQTRRAAQQDLQRLAADHEGVEDDLEGLLAQAETLAGPSPDRMAAYRGAAIGAWRGARLRREIDEDAAWSGVEPYLDPERNPEGWTATPGEVWTALSPRQRTALRGHFETPWRGSDPAAVQEIEAMARGATEAFAELDLTGRLDRLGAADFTRLRGLQKAARAGGPAWEEARATIPAAAPNLAAGPAGGHIVRASYVDPSEERDPWAILPPQSTMTREDRRLNILLSSVRYDDGMFVDMETGKVYKWAVRRGPGGPLNPRGLDAERVLASDEEVRRFREHRMGDGEGMPGHRSLREDWWRRRANKADINWYFVHEQESDGGKMILKAYVPPGESGGIDASSGPTIGRGVDLGHWDAATLRKNGASAEVVAKVEPYLGLKGAEAKAEIDRKPLNLTADEVGQLERAVKNDILDRLIDRYHKLTGLDFVDLPQGTQTAIADLAFHYNSIDRAGKFRDRVVAGDWPGAVAELRNFGDAFPGRRGREAALIEADFKAGRLPVKRP